MFEKIFCSKSAVKKPDYIVNNFSGISEYEGFNFLSEKSTEYMLISRLDYYDMFSAVNKAASKIGRVVISEPETGYIKCIFPDCYSRPYKAEFTFLRDSDGEYCYSTATLTKNIYVKYKDWVWDYFLNSLYSVCPSVDFFAYPCCGNPKLKAVLELGSDERTKVVSETYTSPSLIGCAIGSSEAGFMGGSILGQMMGTQHTTSYSVREKMKSVPVKIIYNNGRVYSGSVKKNTRLYRQILAMENNLV